MHTASFHQIQPILGTRDLAKAVRFYVDRMGFTNRYVYDNVRRMTYHTNALGRFTQYNYCSCGALDSVRDAGGNFTYYFYDVLGRLISTTAADNGTNRRDQNCDFGPFSMMAVLRGIAQLRNDGYIP